ncbi:MAG: CvpA family protein [Saprospiraceae bacterium]|nr:CvpA family protein [Saprospiraceae bacterium]
MVIDIVFALVALFGFYMGYSRGIIQTVFTVLSIFLGLLAAFKFSPTTTQVLKDLFNSNSPLMFVAGFIATLLITIFLIRLISRGIEGFFETIHINFINQIVGGVVLAGVMILLYSVVIWFGDKSHVIDQQTKDTSVTYTYLQDYPQYVWRVGEKLQPTFQEFWDYTIDFMDQLEEMSEQTESEDRIYDLDENESDRNRNGGTN